MNRSDLTELKAFKSPPPLVKDVMSATCMLLGTPEAEAMTWKTVQNQMNKSGRESLAQKIVNFDPKLVSLSTALNAKKLLSTCSVAETMAKSKAAAGCHQWANGAIEEVEKCGEAQFTEAK